MPTAISPEVYTSMGLNEGEYARIVELLGREPSYCELGMFAVMWSEHCGYKYSRPILAYFKQYKEALEGEGLENAGVVPIGNGWGVTMKVESHNHPSAVEPYQGAATGVGGIIRDILTMGARPIAALNSLRFGPIESAAQDEAIVERNKYLFEHVVSGIAGYGNCVGVPTVAGEVSFDPLYSGNPLVNAMCVGLLRTDEITTAAATGAGNPVIYLGSATGKDGIHGATFASDALGEDSDAKRPNVQIGDPFAEKLLIEATLEALATGAVVAIQDMGAAGLTCSTVEMSSKGGAGMTIDLDLVPMRESDMSGYELLLSESQERMLAVAAKGREREVLDVFHKWGLKAVVIGEVIDEPVLSIKRHGEVVASLDPRLLTDHCPVYYSKKVPTERFERGASFDPNSLSLGDPSEALLGLLSHPIVASKRWVYRQYDQQVQTQTAIVAGEGDAAALAVRGTGKGIAVKLDGCERWVAAHPLRGGQLAVAEACRNVACTGALPIALTDGLNFGNPQEAEVYWQFDQAVKGVAEAAEALETPVISGNVSFYNQSDLGQIPPTPIIGALGVIDDPKRFLPSIQRSGSGKIGLLEVPVRAEQQGLGASLLGLWKGKDEGYPEAPNLEGEHALYRALNELAIKGLAHWAHDSSDGGLAVALAEVAIGSRSGLVVSLNGPSAASAFFGEIPGRVVLGFEDEAAVRTIADAHGLTFSAIGHFSGQEIVLTANDSRIQTSLDEATRAYEEAIPTLMAR